MTPTQLFGAVCITCHGPDGKGVVAMRLIAPQTPDFTDPKWQSSRTDADLVHSISDGKGQLMLSMQDKLAIARLTANDMTALVRGFRDGKQIIPLTPGADPQFSLPIPGIAPGVAPAVTATSATSPGPPSVTPPSLTGGPSPAAQPPAPAAPAVAASPSPVTPNPAVAAAPTPTPASSGWAGSPAAPVPGPAPTPIAANPAPSSPASPIASSSPSPAPTPAAPTATVALAPTASTPAASGPEALASLLAPAAPAANPEKERASAVLFGTTGMSCITCHGPDGRGTAVRALLPAIPDFTNRQWQESRTNPQLAASILEGKGTLMPAWRGRVTPEQADDLANYVRKFGPADLAATPAPNTAFAGDFGKLVEKWDELERQVQALNRP